MQQKEPFECTGEKPESKTTSSTSSSSVSVGGNVEGNVITGNSNKVGSPPRATPWWDTGILRLIAGWLLRK